MLKLRGKGSTSAQQRYFVLHIRSSKENPLHSPGSRAACLPCHSTLEEVVASAHCPM